MVRTQQINLPSTTAYQANKATSATQSTKQTITRMKAATIIVVLGFVSMAFATCFVDVTPVPRAGSTWPVSNGAGVAGIIDIVAKNEGDQTARRVFFDVVLPTGVDIIQWWQFSRLPPTYEDMPDSFTAGSSYSSAGFVVQQLEGTTFPTVHLAYNYTVC